MNPGPPLGSPAIAFTADFRAETDGVLSEHVALRDGRLHLGAAQPGCDRGFALGPSVRDVIIETEVALCEGGDDCYYGLFVRQAAPGTYYTFAVSPGGLVWVRFRDQDQIVDVAHGRLAADLRFYPGLHARNRLALVAAGPCLSLVLNGMMVTGTLVDPRCKEGFVGLYLHQGALSPRAELAADWLQVRALFPAQPDRAPSAQAPSDDQ